MSRKPMCCVYREQLLAYSQAWKTLEEGLLYGDLWQIKNEVLKDVANMAMEAALLKMKIFQRFEADRRFDG